MFKTYDGNLRAAAELGRLKAAVAGDNLFVLIDQNWRIEAERFDAPSDCLKSAPDYAYADCAGRVSNLRSGANISWLAGFLVTCATSKGRSDDGK